MAFPGDRKLQCTLLSLINNSRSLLSQTQNIMHYLLHPYVFYLATKNVNKQFNSIISIQVFYADLSWVKINSAIVNTRF